MKVLDNAITDKKLLAEISNDTSFFPESVGNKPQVNYEIHEYHDPKATHYSPYMFWDGWWNSSANTLKKRVIQELWKDNLPIPEKEICGFEYWTKTFKPGQYLSPHVDEDSHLYKESQVFKGPLTGCVYYPNSESVNGGFLEIHEHKINDGEIFALEQGALEGVLSPIENRERIAYKPNRLIIFDAGHVVHNTTPTISGTRHVLVINVWADDSKPLALFNNGFYMED
jgi:hypothetical protein